MSGQVFFWMCERFELPRSASEWVARQWEYLERVSDLLGVLPRVEEFEAQVTTNARLRELADEYGDYREVMGWSDETLPPVGCSVSVDDDGALVLSGDEWNAISLEVIPELLRAALDRHELDHVLTGTWAQTCDADLPGAFGGGAFAVSRSSAVMKSAASLAEQLGADVSSRSLRARRVPAEA